jgi:hypothetical protein
MIIKLWRQRRSSLDSIATKCECGRVTSWFNDAGIAYIRLSMKCRCNKPYLKDGPEKDVYMILHPDEKIPLSELLLNINGVTFDHILELET